MLEENIAPDMNMLIAIEKSIPNHALNKIKHIEPVTQYLESKGFKVDKNRLLSLLRKEM